MQLMQASPPVPSNHVLKNACLYYIKDCVHLCLSSANNLAQAVFFPRFCSNFLCWPPRSLAPYYTLYKQLLIFLELTSHHITFPLQTGQWIFKVLRGLPW